MYTLALHFAELKGSKSVEEIEEIKKAMLELPEKVEEILKNTDLIKEFALNINYGPEPDTVSYLIRNGVKVAEAQVRMEDRQAGESYLTLSRSIKYMTHMFVSILLIQNFRKRG